MQFVKLLLHADFRDVARALDRHPPIADHARGRPRRHDDDAVGQRDRLFQVVGDEQHRLAVPAPEVEQQIAHDLPGLGIERPERLVHQEDPGIADQDLGKADALALAARQHVRITVGETAEADGAEPVLRALERLGTRRACDFETDCDIVDRSLPGEQRIGLEEIAGIAVDIRKRTAENSHRSGGRPQQARGDIEQGGLAAAGRADDGDELAIRHGKLRLFDRGIDAGLVKAKRHCRVIERNRHLPCRCHRILPRLGRMP